MVKSLPIKNKDITSKISLNFPKDGFVHKKKTQKFKETPTGKVPLINGSKTQKDSNMKEQNSQKQKNTSIQKSLEQNKEQRKKNHQKAGNKQQELSKKELDKKNSLSFEEDDTDSDEEDINEGIVLGEQSLMEESDDSNSEEESDDDASEKETALPNLLATSLADDTDEDDEDYEEQLEENEKKGVKMFKGLKSNDSSINSSKGSLDKSATDDADTDESDEEVEEEEEEEDDDDDDDDDDEDEDEEEEEEEDDDDDEEEESEDEEVGDESALGLKALLGNSIADDDDDDEDFVEPGEHDEDDTASDEDEEEEDEEEENRKVKNSKRNKNNEDEDTSVEELKNDEKTIFVGNLPRDVTKKQLIKLFKKFGKIDTIRLRGMVPKTLNVPKKVAAKTNELHPKLKSIYAYVRFVSEDSTKQAVSLNGTKFEGNHLTVNLANKSEIKHSPKKCVFVGNLHYHIATDAVRQHFEQCGEIESVRVIKDNKTGVGKGFGYVNFKTEDAVALALELDGTTLSMRSIRVKPHTEQHKKNKEKHRKRSLSSEHSDSSSPKRAKNSAAESVAIRNKKNAMRRKIAKEKSESPSKGTVFQGQKADVNKKQKKSKFEKKKEILAKKLTAKPKKPSN